MKAQRWMLGATVLAIVVALTWFWFASETPRGDDALPKRAAIPVEQTPRSTTDTAIEPRDATATLRSSATELEAAPEATEEPAQEETEGSRRWIEGRTLDTRGEPIGGVEISFAPPSNLLLAESGGDGRFRFETARQRLTLHGRKPGFVTVYEADIEPGAADHDVFIVLAPAVDLAGRVVDPEGAGIAGAILFVTHHGPGLVGFPHPLDHNSTPFIRIRADRDGDFELPGAPRYEESHLRVFSSGFEGKNVELPETSRYDLRITLERSGEAQNPRTFGTVVLPDGTSASGAKVQCGSSVTIADEAGRFELATVPHFEDDGPVIARLSGWQPLVWHHEPEAEPVYTLGPLHLVLPGPELVITGRLERADGSPAEDWRIRLIDPHGQANASASLIEPEGSATTGPDGAFTIEGLAPGAVALRLWNEQPFDAFDTSPIAAGTRDIVLRVPGDNSIARITGRVTFRSGAPVAGAHVSVQFITERSPRGWSTRGIDRTTTDEDGTFELRDVPRVGTRLSVNGDGFEEYVLENVGEEPLVIVVRALVRARVDASGRDPHPESFSVLDENGEPLRLTVSSANMSSSRPVLRLEAGLSGVFVVPETATTLVLLRGEDENAKELSRHPITLAPGGLNVLMP